MKKHPLFDSVLMVVLLLGFSPVRAEMIKHASPNYDRLIGQQELCYRPIYLGESDASAKYILTVERKVRAAANFQENVLLRIGINGESSNEIVISNLPEPSIHLAGAVALTEDLFALSGNGSSGAMLATADTTGKVIKSKVIGSSYQFKGISRVSAEQFLVYGAKSGKPFLSLVNRNLELIKEQLVITKKSFGIVVRAEIDHPGQDVLMVVQSTNDVSFANTDVSIVRSNLKGEISASYVVAGFLGDFIRTNDGVGLVYYDGDKNAQKIKLDFLSNKLKKQWHQDVVNAQFGVIWPRVATTDQKQLLVIAGHGLKLYMVAYDRTGKKQWSYWESGSSLAPAAGYLVAGQAGKLLLLQEARDGNANYSFTESVCNRVRAVGF